jgi:hypothetical protein
MPATSFKRLILRTVLRDVYPMVVRLVAVPDALDLSDFDDIFHALLGWDSGIGYAFRIQGQEFNSFQRKSRSKKLRDFRLHRQEKFLYTVGALDQWEWELRVVDLQNGAEGEKTPVCVGGRGAAPPQYSDGIGFYRSAMLERLALGGRLHVRKREKGQGSRVALRFSTGNDASSGSFASFLEEQERFHGKA